MAAASAAQAVSSASAQPPKVGLSLIVGIGQAYRKKLEELGVSIQQVAEWNADDIDRYGELLKTPHIRAERWVEQARRLLMAEGDTTETAEQPAAKPSRAELVARMSAPKKVVPEVEDDPLAGLSSEEIAALARKAIGGEPQKPPAELVKRGNVTHLKRAPDTPSLVVFDRKRAILQRLDRNRPFSYTIGDFHGSHFSQKGRHFDHEGIEIPFNDSGQPLNDEEIAELYVDEEHIVTDVDEVNLGNWYERKVEYPLELVIKAVHRTYRKKFSTEAECRAFLHQVLRGNLG